MNSAIRFISLLLLLAAELFFRPGQGAAQGTKMIVGQAGVNPGAGLFSIAVKKAITRNMD